MRSPSLAARMEQRNHLTGSRVERSDIASLPGIASKASEGKIVSLGSATVLPADVVVYLVREVCVIFVNQGVFATAPSPLSNQPSYASPTSLLKLSVLPRPGLCHNHDVLQLQAVFEFGKFLVGNAAGVGSFAQFLYAAPQGIGRAKSDHRFGRCTGSDKIDYLLVRLSAVHGLPT